MTSESPNDLVALTERTFEDPEEAIVALEAGLAAEGQIDQWPLTQDRGLVRAKLLSRLGETYVKRQKGDGSLDLERARAAFEEARQLPSLTGTPGLWAQNQHNLGRVYFMKMSGVRADNIERAMALFKSALSVRTREAFPVDWAMTQTNLAIAWANRIRGERLSNIERAIKLFEAALGVYTREAFPNHWARTQYNLSRAYLHRIRGKKADNIEQAIAACEAALSVRTREAFPADWAMTQNILANVYSDRIRGEKADNIERAIALYEAALSVRTREAVPEDWAMTQNNLANAYTDRIRGERADNLERAIGLYEAVLEVYTYQAFPEEWAMMQNNLAEAYRDRIRGDRTDNLERAISLYKSALSVWTRKAFPACWALAQNNLAIAYSDRIRSEKADNIERAIAHYEAALTVRTRKAFPIDWAISHNNLAFAYKDRIRGEKADNIERAIALYEAALSVRTRQSFPMDWAMTQNNLANAYLERIRGEKADNLERAIGLYEAVLEVYTREAFPAEWAATQENVAIAYRHRVCGKKADNIERAIALYEAALSVRTRQAFPMNWASTQCNLAAAYWARLCGEKVGNLERAIGLFEAALTIRSREALPRDHLETARALGEVLLSARAWSRASEVFADARTTFLLLLGQGLEEAEARGLIETAGPLFSCAAYAVAELGENERAFSLACEGKARLMATALRLQRLNLPPAQSTRLGTLRITIREQSRLLERVEGLERTEALDRLATLRRELSRLIALSEKRTDGSDALTQARRVCADGGVVVAPIVTDVGGKLFLAAARPAQGGAKVTVLDLPELTTDRIKSLMRGDAASATPGWLASFARDASWQERKRRTTGAVESIGRELWSLLVGPLEHALADLGVAPEARLVFMPSGGFGLLPLGLAEEPLSGRRLIESREIVYAPSLDVIDEARQEIERQLAPSLAAIINPRGDLVHASIEGAFVAANFQERTLLDAATASPGAALASLKGRSHWHFATHGVFDLDEARRSALAMAEGTRLSVGDLLEADDLGRPRLVVLSACETGLYDIEHTPEEFIGFPGAFVTMGAQAVLGTLWPVNDCASTLLIARFYDGHLRDGLTPTTALRQAQLWLRSATRVELSAYARAAAARSPLDGGGLLDLEAEINGVVGEAVRFFDVAVAEKHGGGRPPPPRDEGEPMRPFAHPIYWGGFVMTGR